MYFLSPNSLIFIILYIKSIAILYVRVNVREKKPASLVISIQE